MVAPFLLLHFLRTFPLRRNLLYSLLFFFTFYTLFLVTEHYNKSSLEEGHRTLQGEVASLPRFDGDGLSFSFKTATETVVLQYTLASLQEKQALQLNLRQGLRCVLEGTLVAPEGKRNFEGLDYENYLHRQSIHWMFRPERMSNAHCQSQSFQLISTITNARQKAIAFVERHFARSVSGVISALLFGEEEGISEDVIEAYQRLGLSHLLAVSGFNVAIVCGLLFYSSIRFGVTRETASWWMVALLPPYILVTGGESSIVRAGCMGMIVFAIGALKGKLPPLFAITAVGLAMLVLNPYYAFELGFQLSFFNVYTLILSSRWIMGRYTSYLAQLAFSSILCQLISFPIILYTFHELSLWSLPLNLVFIPFISLLVFPLVTVSLLFLLLVPMLGAFFVLCSNTVLSYSNQLLLYLAQHTRSWVFGEVGVWFIGLYYAVIFFILVMWERDGLGKKVSYGWVLLLLLVLLHYHLPMFDSRGKVTFLNVGQGDSILVEMPRHSAVYLIDTGGVVSFQREAWRKRKKTYDLAKRVILPALKARGIHKLTKLILTHGHHDHIGSAQTILTKFPVEEVIYPVGALQKQEEKEVLQTALERHVAVKVVRRGMSWRAGEGMFSVLSPKGEEASYNARSIVLRAELEGHSFLFSGDMEREGEEQVVASGQPIRAEVLKVGHHGSHTSSTEPYIKAVSPAFAVISVGRRNLYRHPNADVLDRLNNQGITILRTDEVGDIECMLEKGEVLRWRTSSVK
nr:DNA internalization-related competence protein ComEC/Rec2 [Fictibacillus macauensis]